MQSGHYGIPLSIKGGSGHGSRKEKEGRGGKGNTKNISRAQAKGKRVVEKPTLASERREWRPTSSTSCKLQREDRESSAPRSEKLSPDS
jgi:hypothetical protein